MIGADAMATLRTIALLFLGALSLAACRRGPPGPPDAGPGEPPWPSMSAPGPIQVPPSARGAVSFENGFSPVVDHVSAAVVNVSSTRVSRPPSEGWPSIPDKLRDFFGFGAPRGGGGGERPRGRAEERAGSGVLVSEDGYVLTNNHVVQDANEVRVSLVDRRELRAKVVGTDPRTDIALLKIDGRDFSYAPFGDSSRVKVGDFALALGNPFALGQTVTMGIISAVGRGNMGIVDYEDFLQTDAAINPGNSGGALVNADGELIGINTAILSSGAQGGNQGIGFAVPSNLARAVMEQIRKHGRVIRGFLGVSVQDVTPAVASALSLKEAHGALVADVTKGSPAERAGLERGDVIVTLDGQPLTDARGFQLRIAGESPGTSLRLGVIRRGARLELPVTLTEAPAPDRRESEGATSADAVGLEVAPLSDELRRALEVPNGTSGVAVVGVQPGSRAADAGLRRGDVILEVNGVKIAGPDDLQKALRAKGGRAALALVLRGGQTHYVAIPPSE